MYIVYRFFLIILIVKMKKKILIIGCLGYVGSYLSEKFSKSYQITGVDSKKKKSFFKNKFVCKKYQNLPKGFLKQFNYIFFFAGLSSVKESIKDDIKTVNENTIDLWKLAEKCNNKTKLIYASSASVHNQSKKTLSVNSYDASKMASDILMKYSKIKTLGLQMATISGISYATREELIFNAMCINSIKKKKIFLSNPESYRGLLFLEDLYKVISNVINNKINFWNRSIQCCSCTFKIKEIADIISKEFSSKIYRMKNSKTYSFKIHSIRKFGIKPATIKKQCKIFKKNYNEKN